MTREERELSITYLEGIKEKYIEGEGYERHPLPEYYAIETAIKALEQEPSNISNDGTLTVNVEDGRKISRVLVCGANHWGGLYYPDEQEPKTGQYEKHIDHTDCIWYGNDSGCPVTCSQYRDGWNDAMDYIFKNGKGYQPYRHDD